MNLPASWTVEASAQSNGSNGKGVVDGAGLPASFLHGKSVRTVYGLVPLKYALDWPAMASYDELAGCAAWMGGRIPTAEEARSIYAHAEFMKRKKAENKLGATVPAVNGYVAFYPTPSHLILSHPTHSPNISPPTTNEIASTPNTKRRHLVNDGVEETPPSPPDTSSLVDEDEEEEEDGSWSCGAREGNTNDDLFLDLAGANVGFQNWHPVAVTARGDRLAGQAELGGAWEWTSSPLRRYEGFEPMTLYPLYTGESIKVSGPSTNPSSLFPLF